MHTVDLENQNLLDHINVVIYEYTVDVYYVLNLLNNATKNMFIQSADIIVETETISETEPLTVRKCSLPYFNDNDNHNYTFCEKSHIFYILPNIFFFAMILSFCSCFICKKRSRINDQTAQIHIVEIKEDEQEVKEYNEDNDLYEKKILSV
jgi:hypothetical protein